jgi:hypothetical protein
MLPERRKYSYVLTSNGFPSYRRVFTFASMSLLFGRVLPSSVLVAHQELSWDLMPIKNILRFLVTRLLPVIILFNMVFMQTGHMNKYIVWISSNEADRFDADLVISMIDEVRFFLNGKQVKSYDRKYFELYNPTWVKTETT